jgi:superfamily II DNA or RNA helicase
MFQAVLPRLESKTESFDLRPHQQECVDRVIYAYFYHNRNQGVIEAPCASGKTISALAILRELIRRDTSTTALLLVPTIALAHQVVVEAKRFFPHHQIGLVQAENREYNHKIVVATIETLSNPLTRMKLFRVQRFRKFSFIWIDEAHLFTMSLDPIFADLEEDGALRLGTSATVWRSDDLSLSISFPHGLFHSIDREPLVEEGYVLPFKIHKIETTPSNRYEQALWAWKEHAKGKQTIVFANSKNDVIRFHRFFKKQGIKSAIVLGDTPDWKRDEVFRDFREGKVLILVSFGVLVTGVDFPWAVAAIIARNTWMKGENTVGHHQATGRVGRTHGESAKQAGILIYLTSEKYSRIPQIHSSLGELPGKTQRKPRIKKEHRVPMMPAFGTVLRNRRKPILQPSLSIVQKELFYTEE